MFISEIKIDTYNIPLPEPVEAYAAGVMKSFDLVVCRITNDDEVEGWASSGSAKNSHVNSTERSD